jgi:hypothetical protein
MQKRVSFLAAFELIVGPKPSDTRRIASLAPWEREQVVMRVHEKFADGDLARQIKWVMERGTDYGDQTEQPDAIDRSR